MITGMVKTKTGSELLYLRNAPNARTATEQPPVFEYDSGYMDDEPWYDDVYNTRAIAAMKADSSYSKEDYDTRGMSNYWVKGMPVVPLNHMEAAYDPHDKDVDEGEQCGDFARTMCNIVNLEEGHPVRELIYGESILKDSNIRVSYGLNTEGRVVLPSNGSMVFTGERMLAWVRRLCVTP